MPVVKGGDHVPQPSRQKPYGEFSYSGWSRSKFFDFQASYLSMADLADTGMIPDPDLISRSLAGDNRSFSILHARYAPRLFSYCFRLLEDRSSTREIVQSTFIKAWKSLKSLDDPNLFIYWLFSIARNEVYASLRVKRRNGVAHSLDDEEVWLEDPTHESFLQTEVQEIVRRSLSLLKHEYREVLILRQFEQLSYAEISAITGDTLSSVESRLFKARKALVKHLKPYVDEWRNV